MEYLTFLFYRGIALLSIKICFFYIIIVELAYLFSKFVFLCFFLNIVVMNSYLRCK